MSTYNKKIEVIFSKESEVILDSQSKICNSLYNRLLQICKDDYDNYGTASTITFGNNIRDMVPLLKYDYPFLKSVHSSPTKNVARRLQEAYERFYSKLGGYPKYRSWKEKWFSLYFDEPNKGFKFIDKKELKISLGKDMNNKQMCVYGILKENLSLSKIEKIKTFRLCKEKRKFYGIFTIKREEHKEKEVKSWISIDQNHKNFFIAIDNKGETFEFLNMYQTKYFDKKIDLLKAKRDICNKKHKEKIAYLSKKKYYIPNKRWVKLNNAIRKVEYRKQEQIKQIMYSIAHFIAKNYDKVIIGNYIPSKDTVGSKYGNRAILNQSHIGKFRSILKWVMTKAHKSFNLVDEKYTTQTCSRCGTKEKKSPDIREFTCKKCNAFMLRDVNSAINIAKKINLEPVNPTLEKINRIGTFIFKQQRLIVI